MLFYQNMVLIAINSMFQNRFDPLIANNVMLFYQNMVLIAIYKASAFSPKPKNIVRNLSKTSFLAFCVPYLSNLYPSILFFFSIFAPTIMNTLKMNN